MLGLGVMIGHMFGDGGLDYAQILEKVKDKTIKNIDVDGARCLITFDDESKITIVDDGQSCCESRYIVCDDDVSTFIGDKFIGVEEKNCDINDEDYGTHEIAFIDVVTDKGRFQLVNHNEHNGYYGGFCIRVKYYDSNDVSDGNE